MRRRSSIADLGTLALALLLAALPAAAQRRRAVGPVPAQQRILFVGNSLTEANDLPDVVCRLARAGGRDAVCESVVGSGYALEDHAADGRAAQRLQRERWSIVVLQQGPSSLPKSRVSLRQWTATFAAMVRAAGGVPALYAVWPEKARSGVFADVSESYRLAAADVGGLFVPAGDAWLAAWRRNAKSALYAGDDFHPSSAGTYLAALVFYRALFGALPSRVADPAFANSAAGTDLHLDERDLAVLRDAADEAVAAAAAGGAESLRAPR
jgi:hypothetical protein